MRGRGEEEERKRRGRGEEEERKRRGRGEGASPFTFTRPALPPLFLTTFIKRRRYRLSYTCCTSKPRRKYRSHYSGGYLGWIL